MVAACKFMLAAVICTLAAPVFWVAATNCSAISLLFRPESSSNRLLVSMVSKGRSRASSAPAAARSNALVRASATAPRTSPPFIAAVKLPRMAPLNPPTRLSVVPAAS